MARFETNVVENDEGTWDAYCTDTALDDTCFYSLGWGTEQQANDRIGEHLVEHATLQPSRELGAFRADKTQEEYEAHVDKLLEQNSVALPGEANE